jgi:hypothetical protein
MKTAQERASDPRDRERPSSAIKDMGADHIGGHVLASQEVPARSGDRTRPRADAWQLCRRSASCCRRADCSWRAGPVLTDAGGSVTRSLSLSGPPDRLRDLQPGDPELSRGFGEGEPDLGHEVHGVGVGQRGLEARISRRTAADALLRSPTRIRAGPSLCVLPQAQDDICGDSRGAPADRWAPVGAVAAGLVEGL